MRTVRVGQGEGARRSGRGAAWPLLTPTQIALSDSSPPELPDGCLSRSWPHFLTPFWSQSCAHIHPRLPPPPPTAKRETDSQRKSQTVSARGGLMLGELEECPRGNQPSTPSAPGRLVTSSSLQPERARSLPTPSAVSQALFSSEPLQQSLTVCGECDLQHIPPSRATGPWGVEWAPPSNSGAASYAGGLVPARTMADLHESPHGRRHAFLGYRAHRSRGYTRS
ncbi:hypothetical protein PYCCODRAFT_1287219 [Trametes coccinea BRFM310]|uniref:Uncharacterized protein n=1 Tax=Trametes coccinea (strain BRFM310) TaxID=1353009 RepID=A0A1Y2IWR1_TRAC3|nr:hypothetical protein PYCCODRAFT_1287219 [Trametes coccinea BRFM310]